MKAGRRNKLERTLIAPGVHLSCDPASKFNRCRISIHFAFPAQRKTATAHALLPLVMERGYADCPDMTRLTKKLAKLYGADLTVDARPMGCNHNLCVSVTGIKDAFALEGEALTAEYTKIALGAAFHPYLVDGCFDPQAVSIEKLQEVLPEFLAQVYDNPTFQMADVDLKFSSPEMRVTINRDKAGTMGVSVRDIGETLQYGLSGQRMGYFYMNGKQYEILGQINRQQRNQPANIKSIYIRSDKGEMIQLDNLVEFIEAVAPPKLYHYNRFISATISAGLAEGKTIGDGLDEMDKIAANVLDDTFRTALSGDSKEYRESSSSLMFAFILALVLIYLILSAQFESFKDPFIIMLTVPLAIAGALVFMYFGDITMNIFSQIGIIMLIGLVAKNGILIVEFANQKQEAGEDKMQAIRDAALQRLRPILMTSASTILGLLPLAFASGEGANQRIAMGVAVVGGMLVSTFLTMYIVPAIYSYISTNRAKKERK